MLDYSHLEEQLSTIHEQMREYQRAAVSMGRKRRKFVVELKMGTGKTLIGLTTLFCFRPQRILILCSTNAFYTWQKETNKWFPGLLEGARYVVVKGTPEKRKKLWREDADVFVATYDTYRIDREFLEGARPRIRFDAVCADELHRIGRYKRGTNPKTKKPYSQKYKALLDLIRDGRDTPFIGLSGGLTKEGPQDLWHYLHLLDPASWPSYWRFADTFCEVVDGMWGREIVGPRNVEALGRAILPYIFRSDEAEKYLPPIVRDYLPVEMNDEQRRMYETLERDRYLKMEGTTVWAANSLTLFMRHRQLLCTPRLLGGSTPGAALEAALDKAEDEGERHFVIYTMFTKAIPHIQAYLAEKGFPFIYTLQGGDSPEQVRYVEEGMRRNRGVTICSILFAQSFEFPTCNLAFFVGPDWDVQNNEQALHRQRRLTSEGTIRAYYIRHFGTCEDAVFESILDPKARSIRKTYSGMQDFAEYWRPKHGT